MGDLLQPWHLIVLFALVPLVVWILYIRTLRRTLERCSSASRTMAPSLVWCLIIPIPIVNLTLHALIVSKSAKSLANEFKSRNVVTGGHDLGKLAGYTMCGMALLCDVLILTRSMGLIDPLSQFGLLFDRFAQQGEIFALLSLICWIIYWVKISRYSKSLSLGQGEKSSHANTGALP